MLQSGKSLKLYEKLTITFIFTGLFRFQLRTLLETWRACLFLMLDWKMHLFLYETFVAVSTTNFECRKRFPLFRCT